MRGTPARLLLPLMLGIGGLVLLGSLLRQPPARSSADHTAIIEGNELSYAEPAYGTREHHVFLPLVCSAGPMTETRALWVTRWNYSTVTDTQSLIEKAADAGFNTVLFQVRGTADAFYTPGLEPWAARLSGELGKDPGWDPLQTAIEAAHARGLELHAYLNVYPVWTRSEKSDPLEMAPPRSAEPEHLFWTLSYQYNPYDIWRITDISETRMSLYGTGYLWPSPALEDVEDRVVGVVSYLLEDGRYDVDGIHLDLVRYPGPAYSYDPFTEAALAQTGLSRADWQRRRVTELVGRIYAEAILPRPEVQLSAAVWPVYRDRWGWDKYIEGYSDLYQDSQAWVQTGVIDAVLPMIYPADVLSSPDRFTMSQFSLLTADFLGNDAGRHVFPGITAQYGDFVEIAERITIARQLGAPGHAIFSAGVLEEKGYWDDLAAGPYAREAVVPGMPWRELQGD